MDKATVDIRITVPKGREVIANGHLVSRTVRDGLATVRWRADEPMAPYLAFFAAGEFAVDNGTRDGLPWYVAVSRRLPDAQQRTAMDLMRRHAEVVQVLEGDLGSYPFSTTGGVTTDLPVGFALENQTRPTYPYLGAGGLDTVVHEVAHQWFGDSVAVRRWRDIWLNEGPATFYEYRWTELQGGQSVDQWLREAYDGTDAGSPFWDRVVADPGPGLDELFSAAVYYRGAMTIQALRNRVGETDFWALMRAWVTERADGNGSTEEFHALAEEVSGEDLDGFFEAWVRTGEKPADTAANGLG
jgi:aminopeptidase N